LIWHRPILPNSKYKYLIAQRGWNMNNKFDERAPALGVDIGGTEIETSLVDAVGQILASYRRLT